MADLETSVNPADVDPLRAAYSAQGTVSPDLFSAVMAQYRLASDRSVAELPGYRDVPFDHYSQEQLDVWGTTPGEHRPTVVAFHGGYWRMLSRHDTAFMAAPLAERGIATVTVDYTLAPVATLEEIVRQVRAAIAWVHHSGRDFGLDRERIIVLGSSAGAHLAAMTTVGGWQSDLAIPANAVQGALLLSGLYDLRPLVRTFPNEWLKLAPKRAAALSPLLLDPCPVPAVVVDAEVEASGFHEQSAQFAEHWRTVAPVRRHTLASRNHFDAFLDLADAGSPLFEGLVNMVSGAG